MKSVCLENSAEPFTARLEFRILSHRLVENKQEEEGVNNKYPQISKLNLPFNSPMDDKVRTNYNFNNKYIDFMNAEVNLFFSNQFAFFRYFRFDD